MNERIIAIAKQAGFNMWADEPWNPGDVIDWSARYDEELENFCKLVVQECTRIAELKEQGYNIYDSNTSVGWYIRQHFGIEK